jgi:hypothetical protein
MRGQFEGEKDTSISMVPVHKHKGLPGWDKNSNVKRGGSIAHRKVLSTYKYWNEEAPTLSTFRPSGSNYVLFEAEKWPK